MSETKRNVTKECEHNIFLTLYAKCSYYLTSLKLPSGAKKCIFSVCLFLLGICELTVLSNLR